MYIEGTFENEGKSLNCVMINIPVYDYNGNRIGTAYTSLSGIRHGEKWNFRAIEIGSGPFQFGEAEIIAY
nr:FxLYD domain-containing protein [Clostridium sp. NSJ-145]